MALMWRMPLAASPHGLGTPPTTTMRRPGRAIACSVPRYVTGIRSLLAVEPLAHRPGLGDGAVVRHHHDAEQEIGRLLDRARPVAHQRLAPGERRWAGLPVEHD